MIKSKYFFMILPIISLIFFIGIIIITSELPNLSFDEKKEICEAKDGMLWGKGTITNHWDCYPFTIDKYCYSYPEKCPIKWNDKVLKSEI